MAVLELHHPSQALRKQVQTLVILPDELSDRPLPVVYQLHGLSDCWSTWHRRTSIERHAQAHGLMIVCPDGGRGWYTNSSSAYGAYEDHILETVRSVDRLFRTVTDRRGRGIGGLSMGGYGAVKIGLKYPDLFGSIAAHSGALDIRDSENPQRWPEYHLVFGERPSDGDCCFRLAEHLVRTCDDLPRLRFDCGVDDFLIDHNRRFHAHCEAIDLPHEYAEFPGAHSWDYWDRHVVEALQFHTAGFADSGRE